MGKFQSFHRVSRGIPGNTEFGADFGTPPNPTDTQLVIGCLQRVARQLEGLDYIDGGRSLRFELAELLRRIEQTIDRVGRTLATIERRGRKPRGKASKEYLRKQSMLRATEVYRESLRKAGLPYPKKNEE